MLKEVSKLAKKRYQNEVNMDETTASRSILKKEAQTKGKNIKNRSQTYENRNNAEKGNP